MNDISFITEASQSNGPDVARDIGRSLIFVNVLVVNRRKSNQASAYKVKHLTSAVFSLVVSWSLEWLSQLNALCWKLSTDMYVSSLNF